MKLTRVQRHQHLKELLNQNPLSTDEDLAVALGVSLSTIRLDRALMKVPEVRERAKTMAQEASARLRSLRKGEYTGQLLELEPDHHAMSLMQATPDMVFRHTSMIWDHYIYAQASSLAIAVVADDLVVIGAARVRYRQAAHVGDQLVARAKVGVQKGNKVIVSVRTTVGNKEIFLGRFIAAKVSEPTEEAR